MIVIARVIFPTLALAGSAREQSHFDEETASPKARSDGSITE
jgi:hypothetical protein